MAEKVGDRFSADRLTRARRPGKIEGESEPCGMSLAKTPSIEDKIVLCNLRQCEV
jgi:hypothetical protein